MKTSHLFCNAFVRASPVLPAATRHHITRMGGLILRGLGLTTKIQVGCLMSHFTHNQHNHNNAGSGTLFNLFIECGQYFVDVTESQGTAPQAFGSCTSNAWLSWSLDVGQTESIDLVGAVTSIAGTVARLQNSPNFAEFVLNITAPPAACINNDWACTTDWRQAICNAQT